MKDTFQERKHVIRFVFALGALVLLGRSFHLQMLDTEYISKAERFGRYYTTIYPSRGLIFDRNGKLLVQNDPMYDITATYNDVRDIDTTKLCGLLGIDSITYERNLNKDFDGDHRYTRYKPFVFLPKVSALTYLKFQESQYQFPGFQAELRNVRTYYYQCGAHVLGYISEVDERQVARSNYYDDGDYIGESGMEKEYEKELRGQRGKQYFTRDNMGRVVGSYKDGKLDEIAVSGKNLVTSLDIDLQKYGEELMRNKKGSIVAIEPSTGEVLAFISSPSYSPNMLRISRGRGQAFARLQADTLKPLFNRALNAQYPPGSTFKPLMSLIALQEKAIWSGTGIQCYGSYKYKNKSYGCRPHPEPITNLSRALKYSCNSYYWRAFRNVVDKKSSTPDGVDNWAAYVRSFGLGEPLGIDIEGEKGGNVPDASTYNKIYPDFEWGAPTVMSVAIGQGELQVTPIQLANMAAIIANRGYYYAPHLAKGFVENDTLYPLKNYERQTTLLTDPGDYKAVIRGMEYVIENTNSAITDVSFCGKTGTVENPHGEDHSTFIGFAPKDNPTIAIAVYVENSGYGSTYARPIASLMTEKFLKRKIEGEEGSPRKLLEKKMMKANLVD